MSADLNTYIEMSGTRKELLSMLKAVLSFSGNFFEEQGETHYSKGCDYAYLDSIYMHSGSGDRRLENSAETELGSFLSENFASCSRIKESISYLDRLKSHSSYFQYVKTVAPFSGFCSFFNLSDSSLEAYGSDACYTRLIDKYFFTGTIEDMTPEILNIAIFDSEFFCKPITGKS